MDWLERSMQMPPEEEREYVKPTHVGSMAAEGNASYGGKYVEPQPEPVAPANNPTLPLPPQSFLERNPQAIAAGGALLAAGVVWASMALGKAIQRKIDPKFDQWCREKERASSAAKSSKLE